MTHKPLFSVGMFIVPKPGEEAWPLKIQIVSIDIPRHAYITRVLETTFLARDALMVETHYFDICEIDEKYHIYDIKLNFTI